MAAEASKSVERKVLTGVLTALASAGWLIMGGVISNVNPWLWFGPVGITFLVGQVMDQHPRHGGLGLGLSLGAAAGFVLWSLLLLAALGSMGS